MHLSDTGLDKREHGPIGTGIVPFDRIAKAMSAIHADVVSVLIAPDGNDAVRSSHDRLSGYVWEIAPRSSGMSRTR